MRKSVLLSSLIILSLGFVGCSNNPQNSNNGNTSTISSDVTIRYLANIPEVSVTLTSGYVATGNNVLYVSETIAKGSKATKPSDDPKRIDYDFAGWYMDEAATIAYDFSKEVTSNLNLYAKWTRSSNAVSESYVEPTITFKEKVDNSVTDIEISGVLNEPITNNFVSLTTIGLRKLNENKDNVKELLNYKINSSCKITSAVYSNNEIVVSYSIHNESKQKKISIADVTGNLVVNNSTYENKAKKYEANSDVKPYSIVLGGSSSMENWSTSTKDMEPLTTVNVGIGGTTVEQWSDALANRLIYPFNPREVVLYVGINNVINSKESGSVVGERLVKLFDTLHEHLPDTTIYYVLMNLIPGYMGYQANIEKGNEIALNYGKDKSYMQYIDAGKNLLKETGKPNSAYFLSDGLHMSLYGYILWGQYVKNAVITHEKEIYTNGRA